MSRAADLLQARAETMKLARLLGCDPSRLAYLERLPPDDLRALRDGVTEALYDATEARWSGSRPPAACSPPV